MGTCPPRDCANREGPKWLHERLYNEREAELKARVDRHRLFVTTLSPGNLPEATRDVDAFVRRLEALDRPASESDVDLDALCDPADNQRVAT